MSAPKMREGLWEDIEHDPSFKKQRLVGQYGLGVLINAINGYRPMFGKPMDPKALAKHVLEKAELVGLITYDNLKHAPACRANRWDGQVVPEGPCNCGAWEERKS